MKFECPDCRQRLECDDECAGRKIQCPSCKISLVVPSPISVQEGSIRFCCVACGQHIECPSGHEGSLVECPVCSRKIRIPSPESAAPSPGGTQRLKNDLQSNVAQSGMTISQFLSQQKIEMNVQLDTATEASSTASEVLTSEEGRKYKLGNVVACGGMGAILDARDMNIRRNVAMKVMLDPNKASRLQVMRFIEEAQITGQLEHPGIVPIYELGLDATGNVFYTMRFVSGITLKDVLRRIAAGDTKTIGEYPLEKLLTIFQKVCDAIAYAHSKHVIHRDIKPDNIMIGDYGEVLVLDWGLAKVLPKKRVMTAQRHKGTEPELGNRKVPPAPDPRQAGSTENALVDSVRKDAGADVLKTLDGAIMGTPGYMSPEQATGDAEGVDERSDIYALGAILYTILTLRPPIKERQLDKALEKVLAGDIPDPSVFNISPTMSPTIVSGKGRGRAEPVAIPLLHCPDYRVPESLCAVVMKALERDWERRYPTVTELQKDVAAYQAGFATSVERLNMWKQLKLFVKRNKAASVTALAMAVLLFSAIGVYTWINLKTLNQLRAVAPDLLAAAKSFVEKQELDKALRRVDYAITLAPERAEYHEFKGNILQALLRLADADRAYEDALRIEPTRKTAIENQLLCRKILEYEKGSQKLSNTSISRLNTAMRGQGRFAEALAVVGTMGKGNRGFDQVFKETLDKAGFKYKSIEVDNDGLFIVDASKCGIADLAPLKSMPLSGLNLADNQVSNLVPLAGMRLTTLNLYGNPVGDLSPLGGMPLKNLDLGSTATSDLLPLKGMPLTRLNLGETRVTNLSPLAGAPLTFLNLARTLVSSISALKGMPLGQLNMEQTRVADMTPLKGAPLKVLNIRGTQVKDIGVTREMPLVVLNMGDAPVLDLSPLKGKRLTSLNLRHVRLSDLWVLKDMPVEVLDLEGTTVSDLSALKGMPLKDLSVSRTKVTDLSPLKGMGISSLALSDTQVIDITPLGGMPLRKLDMGNTGITDLSPLAGMPLESLVLPSTKSLNLSVLKSMKKLEDLKFDQVGVLLRNAFKALDKGHFALAEQEARDVINEWKDFPAMAQGRQVAALIISYRSLFEELKNAENQLPSRAVSVGGHHYLCVPVPRSWEEARDYCGSIGGHLATINSKEESDMLDRFEPKFFFVGFSSDAQGRLLWTTGEPFSYPVEKPAVTGGAGGFDRVFHAWRVVPRSESAPFIIEWDR